MIFFTLLHIDIVDRDFLFVQYIYGDIHSHFDNLFKFDLIIRLYKYKIYRKVIKTCWINGREVYIWWATTFVLSDIVN